MIGIFFGLLGGLALFIFGLRSMSDGLQKLAGKKTHTVMGKLTSLPIVGVMFGALVTIITQSSTLVTVMVVGFVNTSILNLKQAISVIMGANIGTTLTAQLVAFRITDGWVFLATFGFAAYFFFSKHKTIKNTGFVLFSLGLVLLGMALMSQAMVPLRHEPAFQDLMLTFSHNRILAALVGAGFTALIQSSTAATGVIVAMTLEDLIPFQAALPLVLGTNVGTTVTAVLASIGGSLAARRAAIAHVLFNAFGVVLFLSFLNHYESLILYISPLDDIPRQVANAHTMFSVINALLFLPFVNQFANFLTKIIPGENQNATQGAIYLDWRIVDMPHMAMGLVQKEFLRMAEYAGENVKIAMEALLDRNDKKITLMRSQEDIVDGLEIEITDYMSRISQSGMSDYLSIRHTVMLHAVNDVERVSDHADNIADLAELAIENEVTFSDEAIAELKSMYTLVLEIYDTAIQSLRDDDISLLPRIEELEQMINAKEQELRSSHIKRLKDGRCAPDAGVLFLEIVNDFERIGDHSENISDVPRIKLP